VFRVRSVSSIATGFLSHLLMWRNSKTPACYLKSFFSVVVHRKWLVTNNFAFSEIRRSSLLEYICFVNLHCQVEICS